MEETTNTGNCFEKHNKRMMMCCMSMCCYLGRGGPPM